MSPVDESIGKEVRNVSLKYKETKKNKDGSYTEKVRYTDGSGHDSKFRNGTFGRKVESTRRYPAQK
jgi:hypothetical protein